MIEFSCGNCGSKLNVKDKHSGRRVRCPKCRDVNVVPDTRDKIGFRCGHCGRRIRAPRIQTGKKGKCPKCKKVIVVPSLETEPANIADTVSVVCSICDKVVQVRQTSTGKIQECPECGSYIETSARDKQGQSDSSPDEDFYEQSPEEYEEYVAVDRRRIIGISAVAAVVVIGLIILAVVLRSSGSRPAGRPERLRAQQQVADTDSRPPPVTYDQKEVDEWIGQLENKYDRAYVRKKAAEFLGRTGAPRVVPALVKALADVDLSVRISAAKSLGRIGDPQAVQPLVETLGHKAPDEALGSLWAKFHSAAIVALGEIGDPRAVQSLITALGDKHASVRQSAAIGLGEIGDPQAVQPLIAALDDDEPSVRQEAATALGKINDPEAEEALSKAASARRAKEVTSFVIKLVLLCLLVPSSVLGLWLVLKHRQRVIETILSPMSVYLGLVAGFSCAGLLYGAFTSANQWDASCLVILICWPAWAICEMIGSWSRAWPLVLFGCLAYFGIGFRPLLKALYRNERRSWVIYSVVQVMLIILHGLLYFIYCACMFIKEGPSH